MTSQIPGEYLEVISKRRRRIKFYFFSLFLPLLLPSLLPSLLGIRIGILGLFLYPALIVLHGLRFSKEDYQSKEVRAMRVASWIAVLFGILILVVPVIFSGIKFGWESSSLGASGVMIFLLAGLSVFALHTGIVYLLSIRELKKIYEIEKRYGIAIQTEEPIFTRKSVMGGIIGFAVVIILIILIGFISQFV